MCNYKESVNNAKKDNNNERVNNLQAVTNAAKRAYPNARANEAIAMYCGCNLANLRSYRQCVEELHLTPEQVHTLKTIDIWGANSDEWCAKTGAAKYYPRAAFDCSDLLKVDAHTPEQETTTAAPTPAPEQEQETTATAPKKRGGGRRKKAQAVAVDDLPF